MGGLVGRVIKTRAAVKEHQRRLLSRARAVRHEAGTLDVEEEPHSIYGYAHEMFSEPD
jgi:hypothetical protein